tara:strand:- start:807 stop:1850 length:1044 start_codon:yes stop_codon:yes gene_type:complete
MRTASGRQKGERTSYTAPREINEPLTDWMKANREILGKYTGSYTDQRNQWGEAWKTDRDGMLKKQSDLVSGYRGTSGDGGTGGSGGGAGTGTGTGAGSGSGGETKFDAGDNPIIVDDPSIQTPDVASLTDEMSLSNKIQEIINTNNPLFKAATTKAMQAMAKRGLVNSSLAQGEVMNSIMQVALPIAQAEVKALTENLYYNKDWTNKQKQMANEAAYNKMLSQVQGKINYTLQQFIEGSRFGLQKLVGTQAQDLESLSQKGRMALQNLTGEQRTALQTLLGEQGMDLQTLIGNQQLTLQQREIAAQAWGKYGDWISKMASTEGADQEAWKNMLDMLTGAGGWPSLFG